MQALSCNLTDCFLCQHCIPEWKDLISMKKTTFFVRKGKKLFTEGEKVTGIFFMYSGYAKIHTQWSDKKELILRFARKGDLVGHRGLIDGEVYPVSATALEDMEACHVSNEFLEASLRMNPSLSYRFMQLYALELQKAEQRMRDLAHMDGNARIAGALLEMTAFFGLNKDQYVTVPITRQDIASYAGTTYETVFKFLKMLIKAKTIAVSGKSIRINNKAGLHELVKKRKMT
jgi:CRP/FNR family transcriptional regulator